ncbi:MAG: hypothetical protein M1409_11165 [Actinobacteria bacterium]|nr:hypothetical protein [Actinomycetota bacterium]
MIPKIGIVVLAVPQEISPIPKTAKNSMENFAIRAEENLKKLNLDIIRVKEFVTNAKIANEKINYLINEKIDCLIFEIGSWPSPSLAIDMINKLDKRVPIILWATSDQITLSLVPTCQFHGAFDDMGIEHEFIFADPEDNRFKNSVSNIAKAGNVTNKLNGMNMGLFGGRYMNMYTGTADPIQVKKIFGVEITHINESCLVDEAEKIEIGNINDFSNFLHDKYKSVTAPPDVENKSIRLYFAMKKLKDDYNLNFAAVKCMIETQGKYCSHCLSVSQNLDEGFVIACEADINAAITMQIMHMVSGSAPGFGDFFNLDMENNILKVGNCGTFATEFAKDPKDVVLNEQYKHLVPGPGTGMVSSFICKSGKVTLARLGRINGNYVMQISNGDAIYESKDKLTKGWEKFPHLFVKKFSDPETFLQNTRSNHIHWVYGDYIEELKAICKILEIREIVC